MKGIVWLASYPKSGNTWFRVFLNNLKRDASAPIDINRLQGAVIASDRDIFNTFTGMEASNLTETEIDRLRPRVYERLYAESDEILYCKIHDAYSQTADGVLLISPDISLGAIYIIRNPLDVAVSYAYHQGIDIDAAMAMMADESHALSNRSKRLPHQLRQRLLTWSNHVSSWVDLPTMNVHVMLYEDMHRDPLATFSEAARFSRLPADTERVKRALAFSSFEVLQEMEIAMGFSESSRHAEWFFRYGQVGTWRKVLNRDQVKRLCEDHGEVMSRFGYLSGDGKVIDFPTPKAGQRKQPACEPLEGVTRFAKIDASTVVVQEKEVVDSHIDGELVLFNTKDGTSHGLDRIAARIWALMEKPITVSRICARLMRDFDVAAHQCEHDVLRFLQGLSKAKLIQTAPSEM